MVSYISNKMVVSKKKLEKMMSPIADNEEEDEGWMGVDIDFWILLVKIFNRVRNFYGFAILLE